MKKLFIILFILLSSIQAAGASYDVFVKTLWNTTIRLDVGDFDTFLSIKEKIKDKDESNHPDFFNRTDWADQFYLTLNGTYLDDYKELFDYNVKKEDMLLMVSSDVIPSFSHALVGREAETGEYWTTFYNHFIYNMEVQEGTEVFTVNLDGGKLTVTEVEDRIIKSRQAVVMKNTVDGNITMTNTTKEVNESYYSGNSLKGQPKYWDYIENAYVLNYKPSTGVGFYKMQDNAIISDGKAYLTYAASGNAPAREYFSFGLGTSDIGQAPQMSAEEQAVHYDLRGHRIDHPSRGFYIIRSANKRGNNGKKVIIK
ncbi:MAG: hypothetical protein IJ647_08935 [Prevotella sp.]|nr:hypothetical protein [Prevotella sp.]